LGSILSQPGESNPAQPWFNSLLPLNHRALIALTDWSQQFPGRLQDHFVFPSEKYGESGAVFATDPERPIGRLKEAWEAAKRRTADKEKNLPPVVCRWHDLRHTFLTRILEDGTALPMMAAVMGWSPATTAGCPSDTGTFRSTR
jgi:integrase